MTKIFFKSNMEYCFSELKVGDVFTDKEGLVYMKSSDNDCDNTINLSSMETCTTLFGLHVTPRDCDIVIK